MCRSHSKRDWHRLRGRNTHFSHHALNRMVLKAGVRNDISLPITTSGVHLGPSGLEQTFSCSEKLAKHQTQRVSFCQQLSSPNHITHPIFCSMMLNQIPPTSSCLLFVRLLLFVPTFSVIVKSVVETLRYFEGWRRSHQCCFFCYK